MQIRNCALHKTHVFFRFDLKHGACSLRPGRIVKELIWTLEAMEGNMCACVRPLRALRKHYTCPRQKKMHRAHV